MAGLIEVAMLMLSGEMIVEITKSMTVEWSASDLHKSQYKRVF
jgi:hypothetical protein